MIRLPLKQIGYREVSRNLDLYLTCKGGRLLVCLVEGRQRLTKPVELPDAILLEIGRWRSGFVVGETTWGRDSMTKGVRVDYGDFHGEVDWMTLHKAAEEELGVSPTERAHRAQLGPLLDKWPWRDEDEA